MPMYCELDLAKKPDLREATTQLLRTTMDVHAKAYATAEKLSALQTKRCSRHRLPHIARYHRHEVC